MLVEAAAGKVPPGHIPGTVAQKGTVLYAKHGIRVSNEAIFCTTTKYFAGHVEDRGTQRQAY